jgi:hypothetical protein
MGCGKAWTHCVAMVRLDVQCIAINIFLQIYLYIQSRIRHITVFLFNVMNVSGQLYIIMEYIIPFYVNILLLLK